MPEGPLGGPRPIASSSMNISLHTDGSESEVREVAIETNMRRNLQTRADVTVNDPPHARGVVIIVKTNQVSVSGDEIDDIASLVGSFIDFTFSRSDIIVSCS